MIISDTHTHTRIPIIISTHTCSWIQTSPSLSPTTDSVVRPTRSSNYQTGNQLLHPRKTNPQLPPPIQLTACQFLAVNNPFCLYKVSTLSLILPRTHRRTNATTQLISATLYRVTRIRSSVIPLMLLTQLLTVRLRMCVNQTSDRVVEHH